MLNQDLSNKDSDVARANVTTGMALPGGAMVEQLAQQPNKGGRPKKETVSA